MKRAPVGVLAPLVLVAALAGGTSAGAEVRFGFTLCDGRGRVDGGDLNRVIRDARIWAADFNAAWDVDSYTVNWPEMKSPTAYGAEAFVRIGRFLGFALGLEYIEASNTGTIGFRDGWSDISYEWGFFVSHAETTRSTQSVSQSISVLPVTLSAQLFLPFGRIFELYGRAGGGIYLGRWTAAIVDDGHWTAGDDFYDYSENPLPPHFRREAAWTSREDRTLDCAAYGWHLGAGLNVFLAGNVALFGEFYARRAEFDDWRGDSSWESSSRLSEGWTDAEPEVAVSADGGTVSGRLWFSEEIWPSLGTGRYGALALSEEQPEETAWRTGVRPARFDLNGSFIRFGIKITFGQRIPPR